MTNLTRRDFALLAGNVGIATFAAGSVFRPTAVHAQAAKVVLGHFGSANPQTFSRIDNTFQQAMGDAAAVEYVGISAGPQILAAMASDSMDICNIGSSPMVVGFGQGLDISMVYVQKIITTSECLAVRTDAGISTVADLKGKKVGLPFNTSVHFALLSAMELHDVDPSEVTLINIKPDSIVAAWSRGDIDAAYIWYPVLGQLVEDNGEIIFTTGDLADTGTLVFDGIVVRNDFKAQHPDLVLAYLQEYDRLCTLYREDPDEVVAKIAPFLSMEPEQARAYVDTFFTLTPQEMATDKWMGLPGSQDTGILTTLRQQAEFLHAADQLAEIPESFEPFVDSSFLAKMV